MDGGGGRREPVPEVSVASFSNVDREQTIEMLLSRERVLSLLHSKTFPFSSSLGPADNEDTGDAPGGGGGGNQG